MGVNLWLSSIVVGHIPTDLEGVASNHMILCQLSYLRINCTGVVVFGTVAKWRAVWPYLMNTNKNKYNKPLLYNLRIFQRRCGFLIQQQDNYIIQSKIGGIV